MKKESENLWLRVREEALPYSIEQLVAYCATSIHIQPGSREFNYLDRLPKPHRDLVVVPDDSVVVERLKVLFIPIFREFCISPKSNFGARFNTKSMFDHPENYYVYFPDDFDYASKQHFNAVYYRMYKFLLGCEHQLQIDIDLQDTIKKIDELIKISKTDESRWLLANLSGLFRGYWTLDKLEQYAATCRYLLKVGQDGGVRCANVAIFSEPSGNKFTTDLSLVQMHC